MNRTYIYVGENTRAVYQAALDFAKGLNCLADNAKNKALFCGACLSCNVFDGNNHPDTFYVTGTKKSIGIDDIREQIIAPMALKPFRYKYKVFIVEKAQELTHAAQNVLLKTIEEPAEYGVFLFVAPNNRPFLPTFLSRCETIRFAEETDFEYPDDIKIVAEEVYDTLNKTDIYGAFLLYNRLDKLDKPGIMQMLDLLYVMYGGTANIEACKAIIETKKILSQNANTQLAAELLFYRLNQANMGVYS